MLSTLDLDSLAPAGADSTAANQTEGPKPEDERWIIFRTLADYPEALRAVRGALAKIGLPDPGDDAVRR
jgi:hypothetical protein